MGKKLKIVLTSLNKSKKSAHCLRFAGHLLWIVKTWQRHRMR